MKGFFLTDRGKVRNHNEDDGGYFQNNNGQSLAVIADGMGGHQAGDVASAMAVSYLKEWWEAGGCFSTANAAESALFEAVTEVNRAVYEQAAADEALKGMGTTIVAAICTAEFVTIAHIGDSRCYLLNEDGFNQVTADHSLVNELVRSGQISEADAEHHPRKNVLLRALGTDQNVTADVVTLGWEPGDRLLLCSDGLTNKIDKSELHLYLLKEMSFEEIAKQLIDLANDRGGEDNISLLITSLEETPAGEEA